jgi:hypothetical protein
MSRLQRLVVTWQCCLMYVSKNLTVCLEGCTARWQQHSNSGSCSCLTTPSLPCLLPWPAGPGTTVKTVLTDAAMRRIAKLSEDDELFAVEEY